MSTGKATCRLAWTVAALALAILGGQAAGPASHAEPREPEKLDYNFHIRPLPDLVPVPPVSDPSWPIGSLDAFIRARLDREGLKPSPPASKETWIRRVTFDLTGLPPTPTEVDAFLADSSPQAFERVVDRLL